MTSSVLEYEYTTYESVNSFVIDVRGKHIYLVDEDHVAEGTRKLSRIGQKMRVIVCMQSI